MPAPDDYLADLKRAYNNDVERRDGMDLSQWRVDEIDAFLEALRSDVDARILELGSGTGQIAEHVQQQGFEVTAVDLSPANVTATANRGVEAVEADFGALPFANASFDGGYAVMSLIHVPPERRDDVYREIRRVLRPGSLLLVMMWSSVDQHEGGFESEWLDPPRYFSLYTDDQIATMEFPGFERVSFTVRADTGSEPAQVLMLRAV